MSPWNVAPGYRPGISPWRWGPYAGCYAGPRAPVFFLRLLVLSTRVLSQACSVRGVLLEMLPSGYRQPSFTLKS